MFRRRTKRKLLYVWLLLCFGIICIFRFDVSSSVDSSSVWKRFSGMEVASALLRNGRQSCDPATLPVSIQLHCRMYRQKVITGSLCSPLCDLGQICDLTNTYGNAHKEVMVTQCHGFCRQGQSVKAILKHDEVYASTKGYEEDYSTANRTAVENQSNWLESLKALLQRHLPDPSLIDKFLLKTLEDKSVFTNEGSSFSAFYNTFTQLFRQKEYVLFQAYKSKGVFPKVYGACGPLYLVEFCDPVLKQERRHERAFLLSDLVVKNKATRGKSGDNNYQGGLPLHSQSVLSFDNPQDEEKHLHKARHVFFNGILYKLFMDKSIEVDKPLSSSSSGDDELSSSVKSYTDKTRLSSSIANLNSPEAENVYDLNLNSGGINPKSNSRPPWTDQAQAAIKILRFLEYLEHEDTFPEHIHLCDPKLEHFAIGRDDGQLKLIDADLILFDSNMATESSSPDVDNGACTEHEDCSDVMCRGWCRKETGRCVARQINNNLQGICENVFLRPSLEYGPVFTGIPSAVYDDVIRSLCACATDVTGLWEGVPLTIPPASVRTKIVEILEKSLRSDDAPPDRWVEINQGEGQTFDLLFEYCKPFDRSSES